MARYVTRRLVIMLITLFMIITLTWVLSKMLPGTPFADEKLSDTARAQLFAKYSLDQPWPVQYGRYMLSVLQGDLGTSFYYQGRPVLQTILNQAPVSAFLGVQATLFGLIPGMLLGILAALRHNTVLDYLATTLAVVGISVPSFVLGPILQYWVGYRWELLPIAFFETWAHSILPSLALSVFVTAIVARYIRAEMLEVLGQDYITLARAKGLSKAAVIMRHVLRNSLIPLITVLFPLVVGLVTGTIVIEQIFAIPGLGELFVTSIRVNDYAMILGTTIFFSVFFILSYLIQDILYAMIDPRIRVS
jgi:oligopeptide transport system permease protein